MEFSYLIVGMLVMYFMVIIVTGIIASKNFTGIEDYFIGGRKLSPIMVALGFSATGMSGWLTLGFAGYVYERGLYSL